MVKKPVPSWEVMMIPSLGPEMATGCLAAKSVRMLTRERVGEGAASD